VAPNDSALDHEIVAAVRAGDAQAYATIVTRFQERIMNCAELAAALENKLLHERDPHWLEEARRHAEHCPSCTRRLALHRIAEQLTGVCAVEPSGAFLEHVMSRITQSQPHPFLSAPRFSPEVLKSPMIFLGALILAAAYVVPSAGESGLANRWPSVGLFRAPLLCAYLAALPPWAVVLGAVAALFLVFGLALPERQVVNDVSRNTMVQ
jgi:hypothetical protein